jgi:hypothetical protein
LKGVSEQRAQKPADDLGLVPDKMYMNPHTGTVQTGQDWQDDRNSMPSGQWGTSELVEVIKDPSGAWVEREQCTDDELKAIIEFNTGKPQGKTWVG